VLDLEGLFAFIYCKSINKKDILVNDCYRQKIIIYRCINVQEVTRNLETRIFFKVVLQMLGCLDFLRTGLVTIVALAHCIIVIDRRILKYTQM
jgi:hypothetical protein